MGMILTGASMVIGGIAQKCMGKQLQAIGIVVRQATARGTSSTDAVASAA
jgi:hypothetical protein